MNCSSSVHHELGERRALASCFRPPQISHPFISDRDVDFSRMSEGLIVLVVHTFTPRPRHVRWCMLRSPLVAALCKYQVYIYKYIYKYVICLPLYIGLHRYFSRQNFLKYICKFNIDPFPGFQSLSLRFRHYALCLTLSCLYLVRMSSGRPEQVCLCIWLSQIMCLVVDWCFFFSYPCSLSERWWAKHTMLLSNISHIHHHASNTPDTSQYTSSRGYSLTLYIQMLFVYGFWEKSLYMIGSCVFLLSSLAPVSSESIEWLTNETAKRTEMLKSEVSDAWGIVVKTWRDRYSQHHVVVGEKLSLPPGQMRVCADFKLLSLCQQVRLYLESLLSIDKEL